MYKSTPGLVHKNGPERPGDGEGSGEITCRRGKRVGSGGGFEEEKRQEDKDFGPDACALMVAINAESFKRGQDNEDGSPAVVKREG